MLFRVVERLPSLSRHYAPQDACQVVKSKLVASLASAIANHPDLVIITVTEEPELSATKFTAEVVAMPVHQYQNWERKLLLYSRFLQLLSLRERFQEWAKEQTTPAY